jgi:hypothetical protein
MALHSLSFRLLDWGRLKRGQRLQLQADGGTVDYSLVIVVCGFLEGLCIWTPSSRFRHGHLARMKRVEQFGGISLRSGNQEMKN